MILGVAPTYAWRHAGNPILRQTGHCRSSTEVRNPQPTGTVASEAVAATFVAAGAVVAAMTISRID